MVLKVAFCWLYVLIPVQGGQPGQGWIFLGCDSPQPSTLKQMGCALMCSYTDLLFAEYERRQEWSKCFPQETCEVLKNLQDFGKSYGSFAVRVGLFWYLGTASLVQLVQYYWLLKP